jgi:hypothetical protein
MNLTPGSLYFMRERDHISGDISAYVKIGLTRDDRTSESRKGDHQTGNPREIIVIEELVSPAISELETQMHARHAIDRITGEWFALNEIQLSDAYLLAQKLAKNLEKHLPGLQRVEQIANMLSTEEEIKPDSTLLDIHEVYKTNAAELMAVEDELKEIKATLRDFAKNTGGINGVAGWRISAPRPKVDEKRLQKDLPEIHSKFTSSETSMAARFTATKPRRAKSTKEKPETEETTNPPLDRLDYFIDREESIEKLHARHLILLARQGELTWEKDFIETQMKVACGNAKSIEGICSWPRLEAIKTKFDKRRFANAHPDISDSYTFTPAPTYSFIVNEFHPYPLSINAIRTI